MKYSASTQRVKEVKGNVCASEKKPVFFSFMEGKMNHWILLICFSQSDTQVANSFLNVSENN